MEQLLMLALLSSVGIFGCAVSYAVGYLVTGFMLTVFGQDHPAHLRLPLKDRLAEAWDNFTHTVIVEVLETRASILEKAYASARLVKLLLSWMVVAVIVVVALPFVLLGYLMAPLAVLGRICLDTFQSHLADSTRVVEGVIDDAMRLTEGY